LEEQIVVLPFAVRIMKEHEIKHLLDLT
jgi:hypothetical protein